MVGEKAAGAVYARHPRRDWLVDGNRSRTALMGYVGVVGLPVGPLALLALVEKFALSIKGSGASERLVIHDGGHCW